MNNILQFLVHPASVVQTMTVVLPKTAREQCHQFCQ